VGLNTKVGTARFIKALASRLRQDLRGPDGKAAAAPLLKALQAAVAAESSSNVKRSYAAAAAALVAHCVSDKRQEKFITDALDSYGAVVVTVEAVGPAGGTAAAAAAAAEPMSVDDSSSSRDDAARQAGGLLLRELLRESPDTFGRHASQVSGGVGGGLSGTADNVIQPGGCCRGKRFCLHQYLSLTSNTVDASCLPGPFKAAQGMDVFPLG
jgi:hypothetical protein